MRYYLIDYENVNAAGLEGIDEATTGSRVVIFYTKNSNKIDLGLFNLLRSVDAELAIIEVHHGKQALDIQLASYVGFLIGTEPADTEYFIVSKDKGYRNIQDFWSDRRIVLCTSLREDSEIVDDPEPKTRSRSSSRGGRKSSSRSSAKAGKSEEKNEPEKPAKKVAEKAEKTEVAKEHEEDKHSSKKGFRTKAEKNSKREKHHESAAKEDAVKQEPDAPGRDADASVQKESAPRKETDAPREQSEEKKPAMNAFEEAAALAAAMAAAKKEREAAEKSEAQTEKDAPVEKDAQGEKNAPAEKKTTAKKSSSGRKKKSKPAPKAEKDAEAKDDAETKGKAKAKKKAAAKDEAKAEEKAEDKSGSPGKAKSSELRNEVNTEIQKILSKEGFSGDVINATASFVSKNIGKKGARQTIYRGIIKDNGKEQGLAIYRLIKGIL